jgi:predicted permease
VSIPRRILAGLFALVRRRRTERELDEEVRGYLDAAIDDRMRRGMTRDEAVRASRLAIGSLEAVKDQTRDAGWESIAEGCWRDGVHAVRALRRTPTFSAVVIALLGLGIGANTAIFSVLDAFLLRPLPVHEPGELITLAAVGPRAGDRAFSYPAYRQLANGGGAVIEAVATSGRFRDAVSFDGAPAPEPVDLKWVSGNYFTVLGVPAAHGRTLLPGDDQSPPGIPVAVLSDAIWTRRFGRNPSVVGSRFIYKNIGYTVVGVAPRGFFGDTVGEAPDLWLPMTTRQAPPDVWTTHSNDWLRILARRRQDVTLDQARVSLEPTYNAIRDEAAAALRSAEFRNAMLANRLAVEPAAGGLPMLRERLSAPLTILLGAVSLILLIVCANVANLMLARSAVRRRETAVRLAIGAGPVRLIRQLFAEALVVAALGGVLALFLAAWSGPVIAAFITRGAPTPLTIDVSPDVRVFSFALCLSSITALLFGLWPAIRATRVDLLSALKTGSPGARAGRFRLGRALVVGQIALSLVLLFGAGLFVRSLIKLEAIDAGFDPDAVLLFQLAPTQPASLAERREIYRQLVSRAESLPGVAAASASAVSLFIGESWGNVISVDGFQPQPGVTPRTFVNAVTPRHFDVMQTVIIRGRSFGAEDHESAPRVGIVNETFARQFFGGDDAIGRRVGFSAQPAAMMEIVGVVRDAKYLDLRESPRPMLYVPFTQHGQPLFTLEVRIAGGSAAIESALRRELAAVDRRMAIVRDMTLRGQVDWSLAAEQLIARLSAVFGLLALLLAAVGLYGVVAYLTAQRTAEIGIRIALGADRSDVRRLVLSDTLRLAAVGVAIGLPAALGSARLLEGQLYQIEPTDPPSLAIGVVTLTVTALVAGFLPARRAARVDPTVTLRAE